MRVKEATANGFPEADGFGNFFIAGNFGIDKPLKDQTEKSLHEIWNVK